MHSLVLLCGVGLWMAGALPASAEIYRWRDASGHLHYSDTPAAGATVEKLGEINAVGNPRYNLRKLRMRIPFTEANGAILVNGSVNGVAVRFIVDTGASLVVIPPAVASKAGIDLAGAARAQIQTVNGRVIAPIVLLDEIKIGGTVSRSGVKAAVQRVSEDARTGLLGMSFLSAYQVTVDHRRKVLILEER